VQPARPSPVVLHMKEQASAWRVAWKSGGRGRWIIAFVGPGGEEVLIRASTLGRAQSIARAVLSGTGSVEALGKARSAMFPHADCEACNQALEQVERALNEFREHSLHTSREVIPGHDDLYRGRI
jgi:hypothetical protein